MPCKKTWEFINSDKSRFPDNNAQCWLYGAKRLWKLFTTYQNNLTDGDVFWYTEIPVNRFVVNEHKYKRSAVFSTTDDIYSNGTKV
jgi:hypothetical protein